MGVMVDPCLVASSLMWLSRKRGVLSLEAGCAYQEEDLENTTVADHIEKSLKDGASERTAAQC